MPGSARSCSQIHSRNRSSLDTAEGRTYLGGVSAANARRIVLRCNPVRLLISRIDSRSTRCMRRISAHCSTPTTPFSSLDHSDQTRVRTRSDEPTPRQVGHFWTGAGGPLFTRRPQLVPVTSFGADTDLKSVPADGLATGQSLNPLAVEGI